MTQYPLSYSAATEFVGLCKQVLNACKVTKDESVLLFTDTEFYPLYPAAMMAAAQELAGEVVHVTVPSTLPDISGRIVSQAWQDADLVVSMTRVPLLYTEAHNKVRGSGTRDLLMIQCPDTLRRLMPLPKVRARCLAGREILEAGNTLRITSSAGTDLKVDKAGRGARCHYGAADEPGAWEEWPQGSVATFPEVGKVEGTLVLDAGDIFLTFGVGPSALLHALDRHVTHRVTMTIRESVIVSIEGDGEASLIRNWLEQWKDPRSFWIAHVGWGTHHRADWNIVGMDSEIYCGNLLVGVGRSVTWPEGGDNDCRSHMDFCCLRHSFWVDDRLVVDKGALVYDSDESSGV
jgi:2,5-dihydroxypyridine 5,6-dioxygenase